MHSIFLTKLANKLFGLKKFIFIICCFIGSFCFGQKLALPEGFVIMQQFIPEIEVELRYASTDNFLGKPVDGYKSDSCVLSLNAAQALKEVQEELYDYNLCLKIYDGYRPQRAVNHFIRWAKDLNDTINKQQFYPDVEKSNLFEEGYISTHSRHSSGSTVDITIIDGNTGQELDMGSSWDFFGERSWVAYENLSQQQRAHRMLLQTLMVKHGFRIYTKEWWHFTLTNEPFEGQYFDFIVD